MVISRLGESHRRSWAQLSFDPVPRLPAWTWHVAVFQLGCLHGRDQGETPVRSYAAVGWGMAEELFEGFQASAEAPSPTMGKLLSRLFGFAGLAGFFDLLLIVVIMKFC